MEGLAGAASAVLRGLASLSAQLLVTTLATRADLPRSTVDRYVELLEALFLIHRLPPWSGDRASHGDLVVNEIAKQATWSEVSVRLHHYRSTKGHSEADLIIEDDAGQFVAVEGKAAETVTAARIRR